MTKITEEQSSTGMKKLVDYLRHLLHMDARSVSGSLPAINHETRTASESAPVSAWWKSWLVSSGQICDDERVMANALHVRVSDLEQVVKPLRRLHIMPSQDQSQPWPSVHVARLEQQYGHLEGQVGSGTGGTVRLVRDTEHGKVWAVKQFRERRPNETWKHYAECLTREYCISAMLRHPNVIRTVDLIIDQGRFYEVMEYCDMDLFKYIERGGYTLREAYCCFKQVAFGIAYIHSLSIAHLDLKPENVCLSKTQLKIIDFGLCTPCRQSPDGSRCKVRGLCGSAPYIAPEEWNHQEYDPQKVDIWSLGIILITLIFRGFHWETATISDKNYATYYRAYRAQNLNSLPMFQALEPNVRLLVSRMLDPDPATRLDIQGVLHDPWFQSIPSYFECLRTHEARHQAQESR